MKIDKQQCIEDLIEREKQALYLAYMAGVQHGLDSKRNTSYTLGFENWYNTFYSSTFSKLQKVLSSFL